MPLIRIAAFAVLILTAALAIIVVLPVGTDHSNRIAQLLILMVAAVNAGVVAKLARVLPARLAAAGLWAILLGAVLMLATASCPYWVDSLLPGDDSLLGMLDHLGQAIAIFLSLFWGAVAALVIGWLLWGISRFAAHRAARVASQPQLPI